MCNFFFCHYVFKKLSAAEVSESVYMRERVNVHIFWMPWEGVDLDCLLTNIYCFLISPKVLKNCINYYKCVVFFMSSGNTINWTQDVIRKNPRICFTWSTLFKRQFTRCVHVPILYLLDDCSLKNHENSLALLTLFHMQNF